MYSNALKARLDKMSEVAGSRRALARLSGVTDPTLMNWEKGSDPTESKLRIFLKNTKVSREWFVHGRGDEDEEMDRFRARIDAAPTPREQLQRALARSGLSPAELARRINYDAGVIEAVVNGTARASEAMIEAICRQIPSIEKDDLMSGSDDVRLLDEAGVYGTVGARPNISLPPGMKARTVPLLSMAQAGAWDACHDDGGYTGEGVTALNVDDHRAFAITVSGNSMEPDIREGDVVICSPARTVHNGDCVVVRTRSGQAFIKFWRQERNKVTLMSANSKYPDMVFPAEEILHKWPVVQRISAGKITREP